MKVKIVKKNFEDSMEYQIGDVLTVESTWYGGVNVKSKLGIPISLDKDEYEIVEEKTEGSVDEKKEACQETKKRLTFEEVKNNATIRTYIQKADESLIALGFTEHSFAHVTKVAELASKILLTLGYDQREAELAQIAGYLHDIGNIVNRIDHAQSGAVMAFRILDNMGTDPEDIATIITAIGNHDEATAFPVNPIAAALILADKTDVRSSRVRNKDIASFDIHDRVNYAVKHSEVEIVKGSHIELQLKIDTEMCSLMDYFEIFMTRMILCKKAAQKLGMEFWLKINGQRLI